METTKLFGRARKSRAPMMLAKSPSLRARKAPGRKRPAAKFLAPSALQRRVRELELRLRQTRAENRKLRKNGNLRRFHRKADAAPVMIWSANSDNSRAYFNKGWLQFTGRTLEQERGNGWMKGVHPDDLNRYWAAYNNAYSALQEFYVEYRLLRRDGHYRWMLAHGVPRFIRGRRFAGYIGCCMDITNHKEAEASLRKVRDYEAMRTELLARRQAAEARNELAAIVESCTDAIVSARLDLIVTSWNKGAERLYGYTSDEMVGRSMTILHPADRREEFQRFFERVLRGERIESFETVRLRKDGSQAEVSMTLSAIVDSRGRVTGISKIGRDISQRKMIAAALQASEAKFRGLVESAPDAIVIVDQGGRIRLVNSETERMFGYSRKELQGRRVEWLLPKCFHRQLQERRRDVIDKPNCPVGGGEFELSGRRKDGSEFPVEINFGPLRTSEGLLVCGAIRDITERKRLEEEIVQVSEREQRRIAQDLHDGLGQQLAGISCFSKALRQNLAEQVSPEAEKADRISQLLDAAVAQTRALAHGLYPVPKEPNSLMSALQQLAAQVSELFNITCRFRCRRPVLMDNQNVATHLFRIAQEAVGNAIKHGRAQWIRIGLSASPMRVVMVVGDAGRGFKNPVQNNKGLGLPIMRHRARIIGATLTLRERVGGGSEVICTVPVTGAPAQLD